MEVVSDLGKFWYKFGPKIWLTNTNTPKTRADSLFILHFQESETKLNFQLS